MRLTVLATAETLVDGEVSKVLAYGTHGSFVLLPRHIDTVAVLDESVLTYVTEDDGERYVAVQGGILVKRGDEVLVSTPAAIEGEQLEELEQAVRTTLRERSERDREARAALFRLETDIVQRLVEFEEGHRV